MTIGNAAELALISICRPQRPVCTRPSSLWPPPLLSGFAGAFTHANAVMQVKAAKFSEQQADVIIRMRTLYLHNLGALIKRRRQMAAMLQVGLTLHVDMRLWGPRKGCAESKSENTVDGNILQCVRQKLVTASRDWVDDNRPQVTLHAVRD